MKNILYNHKKHIFQLSINSITPNEAIELKLIKFPDNDECSFQQLKDLQEEYLLTLMVFPEKLAPEKYSRIKDFITKNYDTINSDPIFKGKQIPHIKKLCNFMLSEIALSLENYTYKILENKLY